MSEKNYTVIAKLEVRAEDDVAALDQVAEALRQGFKGSGIAPVGTFDVTEGAPNLLDKLPTTPSPPQPPPPEAHPDSP